jgi:outer membrane receptor for ferrienterochelin and colicins
MITLVTIPNTQAPAALISQFDPRKTRQYQNLESARIKGIDVSLRYKIGREWLIGGSFSYLDTDARQYDTDHDRLRQVTIDGTARYKASWHATWNHRFSPRYKLGLGLYGRSSSTRYYQINGNGKGYQLWRLTTTHDLGHARLMTYRIEAGVDNIFNYVDTTPHGLHLGTTTPGRTVYATLTLQLHQGKKNMISHNTKSNFKEQNNED